MSILNSLFGFTKIKQDEKERKKEYRFVFHVIKKTEKDRHHAKYKNWLKIYHIPFVDNSNIRYNKKEKRWVNKN